MLFRRAPQKVEELKIVIVGAGEVGFHIAQRLSGFSFTTCVADAATTHPRQGYVTQHMPAAVLHDGAVDVYLCGPPPMVEAVQKHFQAQGIAPASFHYEKFVTSQPVAVAA